MPDMKKMIAAAAGVAAATGAAAAAYRMRNGHAEAAGVFRVMPDGEAWKVEGADGSIAARYDTKRAALSSGRSLARRNAPSRLVIHRADGAFQREHSYGEEGTRAES